MLNEKERRNREKLLTLIKENPDLPVVPMVSNEFAEEDGGIWLGVWGLTYVAEYIVGKREVYFRDETDMSEVGMYEVEIVLNDLLGQGVFEEMSDVEAWKAYNSLPWTRAIIVDIDLAEIKPERG